MGTDRLQSMSPQPGRWRPAQHIIKLCKGCLKQAGNGQVTAFPLDHKKLAALLSVCMWHTEDRIRQVSRVILVAGKQERAILSKSSMGMTRKTEGSLGAGDRV